MNVEKAIKGSWYNINTSIKVLIHPIFSVTPIFKRNLLLSQNKFVALTNVPFSNCRFLICISALMQFAHIPGQWLASSMFIVFGFVHVLAKSVRHLHGMFTILCKYSLFFFSVFYLFAS